MILPIVEMVRWVNRSIHIRQQCEHTLACGAVECVLEPLLCAISAHSIEIQFIRPEINGFCLQQQQQRKNVPSESVSSAAADTVTATIVRTRALVCVRSYRRQQKTKQEGKKCHFTEAEPV